MPKKIIHASIPGNAPFTIFGISCHLKDYRLSFLLNKNLNLEFVKLDDFNDFSFYSCKVEETFNTFFLLANRNPEAVLLPELKQTDYLLVVEGPVKKTQKEKLLENIRGIQNVLTAFEIRFETIKHYDTLLNDLELHHNRITKELKVTFSPIKKQEE
jgi:hypothetical protein